MSLSGCERRIQTLLQEIDIRLGAGRLIVGVLDELDASEVVCHGEGLL